MKRTATGLALAAAIAMVVPASAFAADRDAAFAKADRNKDGALNRSEFNRFIKALSKEGDRTAKRVTSAGSEGMAVAWQRADGNRDNKVTAKELRRFR